MRMIDADELHAEISKWPDSVMYKDWVQSAIATAPTVPVGGDWVNTKDRLPERNGKYIVTACDEGEPYDKKIWNDTVVVCAVYYKSRWTWEKNNIEYSLDGIVTHWMPLPEPPEERYKCRNADANGVCSKCSGNGAIICCVEGPCPYMFEEV